MFWFIPVSGDGRYLGTNVGRRPAEHAYYRDAGRIDYTHASDQEVLDAFQLCSRLEGIIPALESSHALAHGFKRARALGPDRILIINLSGRGDKDVQQVAKLIGPKE